MALETATYISQLVSSNPTTGDPVGQGDDHLRLLKAVLQANFPNFTAAALNSTQAQIDAAVNTAKGTSGVFAVPLGTVSAPPYAFVGDLNTGIFSPGADQVTITTGGTAAIQVDSSHNTTTNGLVSGNHHVVGTLLVDSTVTFTTPLTGGNIANTTITAANIANTTITAGKIANATITTTQISGTAGITGSQLAAGAAIAVTQLATDTSSKCKAVGYDQSTGVPGPVLMGGPLLHVHESVATNTAGAGTFTAGAYRTRPITQVTNEITGAAVAANQITGLVAGTYMCMGYTSASLNSAAGATALMRCRLRDVTNNTTLLLGSSEASFVVNPQTSSDNMKSQIYGRFTLAGTVSVELQGWFVGCTGGVAVNSGENEIYTDLLIWRIS